MDESINWLDIGYLGEGSSVQRDVYRLLQSYRLMEKLRPYGVILVGTYPIGINVEESDLDLVCEVYDFEAFAQLAAAEFGQYEGFKVIRRIVDGKERIKANFTLEGWPIELFGQALETTRQNGYVHMVVEARLLRLFGTSFREEIVRLKGAGLKTEPAFARLLQLEGDPYSELLNLAGWSDDQLLALHPRDSFLR